MISPKGLIGLRPPVHLASRFVLLRRGYFPSTENASSTFPGNPPQRPYPDGTNIIAPAIARPGPSMAPPTGGKALDAGLNFRVAAPSQFFEGRGLVYF
jgi:hypothetical protein